MAPKILSVDNHFLLCHHRSPEDTMPRRTPIVSNQPTVTPDASPRSRVALVEPEEWATPVAPPAAPIILGADILKPCHCCGTAHASTCPTCGNRHEVTP